GTARLRRRGGRGSGPAQVWRRIVGHSLLYGRRNDPQGPRDGADSVHQGALSGGKVVQAFLPGDSPSSHVRNPEYRRDAPGNGVAVSVAAPTRLPRRPFALPTGHTSAH